MPTYLFHCPICVLTFEDLCSFSEIKEIVCEKCGQKPNQIMTSPGSVIFTNPKGTSREDNFEYVAKYNYERAQSERRAAEQAQGPSPYKNIDDMPKYEGKNCLKVYCVSIFLDYK